MRRMRFRRQAFALLCFLAPAPALAWGPEGHEVVAHLAAMNLTPKARAQVAALLGGEAEASMAIAANWADEIRDARPETSPWHFVNLENDRALGYIAARDCPRDACIVAQIDRQAAILRSNAPAPARAEALKFLIHFVGDSQQPLHAADNHDRGGNQVQVTLRGRSVDAAPCLGRRCGGGAGPRSRGHRAQYRWSHAGSEEGRDDVPADAGLLGAPIRRARPGDCLSAVPARHRQPRSGGRCASGARAARQWRLCPGGNAEPHLP